MAGWSNTRASPARGGSASGGKAEGKMPCVYVLKSRLNLKHYIGSSREDRPATRLLKHNTGQVRSTKSGRPWEILHQEELLSYAEARKRENFLKSGVGRKWIKENIS